MNFNHSIIFIVIESANNISNIKKWICYITIRLKIISRKRRNMMFKKKKLGKLEKIKKEEKKIEDIKEEADKQQEAESEPKKEN